jgi:hypothetical protein
MSSLQIVVSLDDSIKYEEYESLFLARMSAILSTYLYSSDRSLHRMLWRLDAVQYDDILTLGNAARPAFPVQNKT